MRLSDVLIVVEHKVRVAQLGQQAEITIPVKLAKILTAVADQTLSEYGDAAEYGGKYGWVKE